MASPGEYMNRTLPNPRAQVLAERLLQCEALAGNSFAENTNNVAVKSVSEKLRHRLRTLAGSVGYRVLLVRALNLAKTRAPTLSSVQVNHDGSLEGLLEEKQAIAVGATLIGQLLGLLFTFIGEDLTLRIVLDSWPDLAADIQKIES